MLEQMLYTSDNMKIKDAWIIEYQGKCIQQLVDSINETLNRLLKSKTTLSCRNVLVANFETMTKTAYWLKCKLFVEYDVQMKQIHEDMRKLMKEHEEDELKEERKMEEDVEEERFHFIHPEIEDDEAWRIHDAIKRLVTNQRIPEICAYLHLMASNNKILLPQMPSVAYAELVRMGMPTTIGFSEKHFKKYYHK